MDLELSGKVALVTGGSGGIGSAVAAALLREGVNVAITGRSDASLTEARTKLHEEVGGAGELRVARGNTASDDDVRRMVREVVESIGDIDILVNAAAIPGYVSPTPVLESVDFAAARENLDVKVLGYLRCARAVAPRMREQGWGRIVNVSGLATRRTGSIIGSVRNAGVVALTKNLADELGPFGINVTAVEPGPTVVTPESMNHADAKDRISIGRYVTAAEVADVVTFLASPRSIAVNGEALAVGGGDRGSIRY